MIAPRRKHNFSEECPYYFVGYNKIENRVEEELRVGVSIIDRQRVIGL